MYLGGGNNQGAGYLFPVPNNNGGADRIREAGAQNNYKSGGEGVLNPNGKGRVASKKISVQNPPKRFGLAESFGSQKIFRKNFGKMKNKK